MKKKIIFIVSLLLALSIPSVAYAEEYGNTYPAYVPVSGGAYIEVQCALGCDASFYNFGLYSE